MLQREFNDRSLMVKDDSGRYRLATGDEIIEAALAEINRRFARGVAIVKSALYHNNAACILCHNHPSSVADPSQSDLVLTAQVKEALIVIEVRTLDHVIVGERPYSFAEHGLI